MPWVGSKDRTFDRLAMVDARTWRKGGFSFSDNSFMPERKVYTPSEQCILPVSYTHLDVYKRQILYSVSEAGAPWVNQLIRSPRFRYASRVVRCPIVFTSSLDFPWLFPFFPLPYRGVTEPSFLSDKPRHARAWNNRFTIYFSTAKNNIQQKVHHMLPFHKILFCFVVLYHSSAESNICSDFSWQNPPSVISLKYITDFLFHMRGGKYAILHTHW